MKKLYRIILIAEVNGDLEEDEVQDLLADQKVNGAKIVSVELTEPADDFEEDDDEIDEASSSN